MNLTQLREMVDLTQVELAKRLGVSQSRVSRIERSEVGLLKLGTVIRYVEALGCPVVVVAVLTDDEDYTIYESPNPL